MFKKGTIVLTPLPFTDLSGKNVRPAVIISDELKGDDVVVIFITSQKRNNQTYTVALQPTEQNGLKVASLAICSKIATLDKKVILGDIGTLENGSIKEIAKEIKKVLSL